MTRAIFNWLLVSLKVFMQLGLLSHQHSCQRKSNLWTQGKSSLWSQRAGSRARRACSRLAVEGGCSGTRSCLKSMPQPQKAPSGFQTHPTPLPPPVFVSEMPEEGSRRKAGLPLLACVNFRAPSCQSLRRRPASVFQVQPGGCSDLSLAQGMGVMPKASLSCSIVCFCSPFCHICCCNKWHGTQGPAGASRPEPILGYQNVFRSSSGSSNGSVCPR